MTDILDDAAFSRRDMLKGGGALIVGFALAGLPLRHARRAAVAPGSPDPARIDSWIAIHADNTATVYSRQDASSARATPPACCRSPAKSSIST